MGTSLRQLEHRNRQQMLQPERLKFGTDHL